MQEKKNFERQSQKLDDAGNESDQEPIGTEMDDARLEHAANDDDQNREDEDQEQLSSIGDVSGSVQFSTNEKKLADEPLTDSDEIELAEFPTENELDDYDVHNKAESDNPGDQVNSEEYLDMRKPLMSSNNESSSLLKQKYLVASSPNQN